MPSSSWSSLEEDAACPHVSWSHFHPSFFFLLSMIMLCRSCLNPENPDNIRIYFSQFVTWSLWYFMLANTPVIEKSSSLTTRKKKKNILQKHKIKKVIHSFIIVHFTTPWKKTRYSILTFHAKMRNWLSSKLFFLIIN